MTAKHRNTLLGAFIACLTILPTVASADRSWNAGHGNWSGAANWSPNGIPTPGDHVFIGNIGGVADWEVTLDQNEVIAGLTLSNNRNLRTDGHRLLMGGHASVTGTGSLLTVDRGVLPTDFGSDVVSVTNGGILRLESGGILDANNVVSIGDNASLETQLGHAGVVRLDGNGAKSMSVDGTIWSAGILTIQQFGTGLIDLDGNVGNSTVGSVFGSLTIDGTALHDPFGGVLYSGRDSEIHMNIANGWDLSPTGIIRFESGLFWKDYGMGHRLYGDEIRVAGRIETLDDNTYANIHADVVLESGSEVDVPSKSQIDFHGHSEINGGTYTVGSGGLVRFMGDTVVHGGTFTAAPFFRGTLFDGPTTWSGNIDIDGVTVQNGHAVVQDATTITGDVFDLDGDVAATTWMVNAPLTIQTDAIDDDFYAHRFNGTMDIGASFSSALTMQLTDPSQAWTVAGTLNLTGNAVFNVNRVFGNPVVMTDVINVTANTKVGIVADTTFATSNTVNFGSTSSELRMSGTTSVESGATFQGGGTLINGPIGVMTLQDAASVAVDVRNRGELRISDGIGQANVHRFSQTDTGTVVFELGSPFSADQLDATAQVTLDGTLAIQPAGTYQDPDANGTFDEFSLITSTFVDGEFDTVTYNDLVLDWEFVSVDTRRSHEGDGLFRIVEYENQEVSFTNYLALHGDANGDGTVDGMDFTIWNSNKYLSGTDWTTGDFNGDGITDGQDFVLWNTNKFTSVGNFNLV
ncbi:MAG: dockerin type I domain-containing protein, partial [Planctomycetota bacterium]